MISEGWFINSTFSQPCTLLISQMASQVYNSFLSRIFSSSRCCSSSCCLNVPASNPQEIGGVKKRPAFSSTKLPIVNSVSCCFSFQSRTENTSLGKPSLALLYTSRWVVLWNRNGFLPSTAERAIAHL